MDAGKAVELHFADGVIERDELYGSKAVPAPDEDESVDKFDTDSDKGSDKESDEKKQPREDEPSGMLFSRYQVAAAMNRKLVSYARHHPAIPKPEEKSSDGDVTDNITTNQYRVADLEKRLDLMKQFI